MIRVLMEAFPGVVTLSLVRALQLTANLTSLHFRVFASMRLALITRVSVSKLLSPLVL